MVEMWQTHRARKQVADEDRSLPLESCDCSISVCTWLAGTRETRNIWKPNKNKQNTRTAQDQSSTVSWNKSWLAIHRWHGRTKMQRSGQSHSTHEWTRAAPWVCTSMPTFLHEAFLETHQHMQNAGIEVTSVHARYMHKSSGWGYDRSQIDRII